MNMKSIIGSVLAFSATTLMSADCKFLNAGGDLADASQWGGTLPLKSADKAIVDKSGEYTLSKDVDFYDFYVATGGCVFNLADKKITLNYSGTGNALYCKPEGGNPIVFKGGTLHFAGESGYCVPYNGSTTSGTGEVVFTNGCVVTGVNRFYATKGSTNATVRIAGGSKIYTKRLDVQNGSGVDNLLEICDGGQIVVSDYLYSEAGDTSSGGYGGNVFRIRGANSILNYEGTGDARFGYQKCCSKLHVVDNGSAVFNGALVFGAGGNAITNHSLVVERGGTLTASTLKLNSSCCEVIVSNATLINSTALYLASSASCSGNVFRAMGPDTSLTLSSPANWFSSGQRNMISFEGGVKYSKAIETIFTNAQHCVFRVSGVGTVFGTGDNVKDFYIGSKQYQLTESCASNAVEVLDGAVFNANRFLVMGIGNSLVVSNATVNIAANNDSVGLRIGYKTTNANVIKPIDCMLRLCGSTPKLNISSQNGGCQILSNSILRFEIPKSGYATNHVPISTTRFVFDGDSRLEIDCEDFARCGGGVLTLIETEEDIAEGYRQKLLESVNDLPEGCHLKIVSKRKVKLFCPKGFVFSIR